MIDDLILFKKAYQYTLWIFPLVAKFPKQQRFVLGEQIEWECIEMLKTLQLFQKSVEKKEFFRIIFERIDTLRLLIRVSHDMKFFSTKQFSVSAESLNEFERLIAGLTKRFS